MNEPSGEEPMDTSCRPDVGDHSAEQRPPDARKLEQAFPCTDGASGPFFLAKLLASPVNNSANHLGQTPSLQGVSLPVAGAMFRQHPSSQNASFVQLSSSVPVGSPRAFANITLFSPPNTSDKHQCRTVPTATITPVFLQSPIIVPATLASSSQSQQTDARSGQESEPTESLEKVECMNFSRGHNGAINIPRSHLGCFHNSFAPSSVPVLPFALRAPGCDAPFRFIPVCIMDEALLILPKIYRICRTFLFFH